MKARNNLQYKTKKAKEKLDSDSIQLRGLCKESGLGELCFFLHTLHFSRKNFQENKHTDESIVKLAQNFRQINDLSKYLVQLIWKLGEHEFLEHEKGLYIDNKNVNSMLILSQKIHSNFEFINFSSLLNKSPLSNHDGINTRQILLSLKLDSRLTRFFDYGLRETTEHDTQKDDNLKSFDLFKKYLSEYIDYSDLFVKAFKCTPSEFIELLEFLLNEMISKIQKNIGELYNIGDKIDPSDYRVMMAFAKSIFIEKSIIEEEFSGKYDYILDELCLIPFEVNEEQILFDQVARKPLLMVADFYIVSPDVVLDSLFVNTHYRLLENKETRHEYKSRSASKFIDSICLAAKKADYYEFKREVDVFDGKQNLGDIDLVLKSKDGRFLLVEAKNHTLPLDVYWHQFEAEEKRLKSQQNDWEKKVLRRTRFLKNHYSEYNLPENFQYIIVTKRPEILSHFSEILVLSIFEFENWINFPPLNFNFQEVYKKMKINYSRDEVGSFDELVKRTKSLGLDWIIESD